MKQPTLIPIVMPDGTKTTIHNRAGREPDEWTDKDAVGFRAALFLAFNPSAEVDYTMTLETTDAGDMVEVTTENGTIVAGPIRLSAHARRLLSAGNRGIILPGPAGAQ